MLVEGFWHLQILEIDPAIIDKRVELIYKGSNPTFARRQRGNDPSVVLDSLDQGTDLVQSPANLHRQRLAVLTVPPSEPLTRWKKA